MKMLYCDECGNAEHFVKSKVSHEWNSDTGKWIKLHETGIDVNCGVCGSRNVNKCNTDTKGLKVVSYCI